MLEASYVIHRLPPHHRNFSKRLVKTPKLCFHDVGVATWLVCAAGESWPGDAAGPGRVVYGGTQRQDRLGSTAVPWRMLPAEDFAAVS